MAKTYLVTGGCGFIGSHFVRKFLQKRTDFLVNLDLLTYAGNLKNLADCTPHPNYLFVQGDINDTTLLSQLFAQHKFHAIINFAAETHVDRSLQQASQFIKTNTAGTVHLLEQAYQNKAAYFLQISTDEVYGSIEKGKFLESSPVAPRNPYSASKAGADLFLQAFFQTYQFDTRITRCSNNYGSYQFPEKLIPLFITNLLENKPIPLYGDGQYIRDWIAVEDHIAAIFQVMEKGKAGEIYNIGGNNETTNLEITKYLLKILGKSENLIQFGPDRLGHDRRYAVDFRKIKKELGWEPKIALETGLDHVVKWYLQHRVWWQEIKDHNYQNYYQNQYRPFFNP